MAIPVSGTVWSTLTCTELTVTSRSTPPSVDRSGNLTEVLSTAMPLMMMPGREQIATSGFAVNGH